MHKIFANTLFIGKQLISLPSCHSTNDIVADMAVQGSIYEGAVVSTENQTKGKGQRGNTWLSAPGENLTFSIYLKPKFLKPTQQFELNRIVSLALFDVIKSIDNDMKAFIKWPNDLYVKNLKIAGILIENNINYQQISQSIIGIGLNVNQTEKLPSTATSLKVITEKTFALNEVLSSIISRIEHYYLMLRSNDVRVIHQLYEQQLYKKDKVSFFEDSKGKFNGIIRGTSTEGNLHIEDEAEYIRKYQFKEVRFL
ncbi:biotin--[acetyl-CoA-carboxylase] ligase [Marivirga lumbricoides]